MGSGSQQGGGGSQMGPQMGGYGMPGGGIAGLTGGMSPGMGGGMFGGGQRPMGSYFGGQGPQGMGGQFGYPSMGGQFGYPGMGKPTPPQFGGGWGGPVSNSPFGGQMGAQMGQDKMYNAFMDTMGMGGPRMYNQGTTTSFPAPPQFQQGGLAQLYGNMQQAKPATQSQMTAQASSGQPQAPLMGQFGAL